MPKKSPAPEPYPSSAPILITGAGGYIGAALVKAIATTTPAHLILLDSSEQNLFNLVRHLEPIPHEAILGSVTDAALLDSLFRRFRPTTVYHAAALKHVALLERNPFAAVRTNAIGTYTLARAALQHGVSNLVLVSTDKAVNPHSIMGASKRIAELIVAVLATPECRMNAIRLGNVIGSTGSVIPIFLEQIKKGGPITVTHPDVTRYFMSLNDAVEAVLAAGAAESSGRILLPDLGEPGRIADLARLLIAKAADDPTREIPIEFIGLRPGEKLHEDLTFDSEVLETPLELHAHMAQLACLIAAEGLAGLVRLIREMVPEYQPSSVITGSCA